MDRRLGFDERPAQRVFLAFISPIFLFMLYDKFLLRRPFHLGTGDGAEGYFALGLNWLARNPRQYFHQPGYFFQELSGATFALLGLPNRGLEAFTNIGIGLHVAVVLAIGMWVVRIAKHLGLGAWEVAILSLFVIAMPILAGVANNWELLFVLALLVSAAMLDLYALSLRERNSRRELFWPLFTLGFSAANYFGFLISIVAVLAALLVCLPWRSMPEARAKLGASGAFPRFAGPVLVVSGGFFVHALLRTREGPYGKYFLLAVLASALVMAFSPEALGLLLGSIALPLLLGWLAGANIQFRFWFESLRQASLWKGMAVQEGTPVFAHFYPFDFLATYPWYWVVLAAAAASFAAFGVWAKNRKTLPAVAREGLFVFIAVLACIALNLISAANVTLIPIPPHANESTNFYPAWIRYYTPSLPAALICLVWIFRQKRKLVSAATFATVAALSLVSLGRYHFALADASTEMNELEAHIDRYLLDHLEGHVICLPEAPSRLCSVAIGYHSWYRTDNTSYHLRSSPDGRVLYIEDVDPEDRLREAAKGSFLLVTTISSKLPAWLPELKEEFRGSTTLTKGLVLRH